MGSLPCGHEMAFLSPEWYLHFRWEEEERPKGKAWASFFCLFFHFPGSPIHIFLLIIWPELGQTAALPARGLAKYFFLMLNKLPHPTKLEFY